VILCHGVIVSGYHLEMSTSLRTTRHGRRQTPTTQLLSDNKLRSRIIRDSLRPVSQFFRRVRSIDPAMMAESDNSMAERMPVSSSSSSSSLSDSVIDNKREEQPISSEWELDVYSRPVVNGGKKLWEFMLCDATGRWKYLESLSPDEVNSKGIKKILLNAIEQAPVKPTNIRFFRKQAVSIIRKAMDSLEREDNIRAIKSRSTYALFDWLEERSKNVR